MDKLITKNAEHWIDEHGILHKKVHQNVHVDIDSIKEGFAQVLEFTNHKKMLVLYDARTHFTITAEVMEFLKHEIFELHNIATAIVSEKIAVRIMTDYMVSIGKLKTPLKVFSDQKKAIKWLLAFKK